MKEDLYLTLYKGLIENIVGTNKIQVVKGEYDCFNPNTFEIVLSLDKANDIENEILRDRLKYSYNFPKIVDIRIIATLHELGHLLSYNDRLAYSYNNWKKRLDKKVATWSQDRINQEYSRQTWENLADKFAYNTIMENMEYILKVQNLLQEIDEMEEME